ncbi:reprolysin family propeptide-containing metallopeptidase [Methanolobus sp. WCC1]|jgi:hypothetical protein|uniref:Reprolysin family propeptide n=1 Tax=Methanolobus tindarius DSM 2278 TaxID=1090322 RepID=W9DZ30_METTI|nr:MULTISPECIES: reprolysin family propeptide-containing metallopeptidase [Methanolobus]ETA68631.1 Reprolysin family propeptide [Methanolobus tindarius DSM 2278]MDK2831535.1 hypothetical protein [Methanolobus sp.]
MRLSILFSIFFLLVISIIAVGCIDQTSDVRPATNMQAETQNESRYYVSMEYVDNEAENVSVSNNIQNYHCAIFSVKPDVFNYEVNERKTIMLNLMGEEVGLILNETHVSNNHNIRTYRGKVVGDENSKVAITVSNNLLLGTIDVDSNPYYIESTKYELDGKTIHIMYRAEDLHIENEYRID